MKIYLIILLIISSVYVNAQKTIHKEVTNTKIEVTDTKIGLFITKNGKPFEGTTFNVGDSLTVTAKLKDGTIATGGKWEYKNDNNNIEIVNKGENTLTIKLKAEGSCTLYYIVNKEQKEQKGSYNFTINKKEKYINFIVKIDSADLVETVNKKVDGVKKVTFNAESQTVSIIYNGNFNYNKLQKIYKIKASFDKYIATKPKPKANDTDSLKIDSLTINDSLTISQRINNMLNIQDTTIFGSKFIDIEDDNEISNLAHRNIGYYKLIKQINDLNRVLTKIDEIPLKNRDTAKNKIENEVFELVVSITNTNAVYKEFFTKEQKNFINELIDKYNEYNEYFAHHNNKNE